MIEHLPSCLTTRSKLDHAILASVLAMAAMTLAALGHDLGSVPALAATGSTERQPA